MKLKRITTLLCCVSAVLAFSSCSSNASVKDTDIEPQPSQSQPRLSEDDIPALPVLTYKQIDDNKWELKRLRLSQQGFQVLDGRGIVSLQECVFSLSDATDSFRRDVESREEYLEIAFWSGLNDLLSTDISTEALGFLEYYGFYYLCKNDEQEVVLFALGATPIFTDGMPLNEFCRNAWAFYCYIENTPENIYGGDGVHTHNLPGYS